MLKMGPMDIVIRKNLPECGLTQLFKRKISEHPNCLDCLNKSLGSVGGSGRYSCDECGKLFR